VVGATLYPLKQPAWIWALLFLNGFVWPHIAYWLAKRSQSPFLREHLHLQLDAASGGFWVALMGFNPLGSCLILMMLWMNNIAAGGFRLFLRGVVTSLAGLLMGLLVVRSFLHWEFNLSSDPVMIYAALPMLVIYPLAIGSITYRFAMQLHSQKELLKHLSRTDGLTGLFNRSYWEERVLALINQTQRSGQPLCLVLLDVDHFKMINDTYGHGCGDQILQQIAQCLQVNLREHELLGRYGGEEFALALANTSLPAALATAERLRQAVATMNFADEHEPRLAPLCCSISLGLAPWQPGISFLEWQRAADQALYQAKREGRNRSCIYQPQESP